MADEDGTALQDFLGFAQMASQVDPENPDSEANQAFAEWFYEIGDQLGLLDPDNEPETDDPDDPEDGDKPNAEVEELRGIIGQLQARVEQAEAAPRIQSVQQEHRRPHREGGRRSTAGGSPMTRIVRRSWMRSCASRNDYKSTPASATPMVDKAVNDVPRDFAEGLRPSCSAATRTSSESSPEPPRATGCPTRGPRRSPPAIPRSRAAARRPPHCRGWVADPNVNYAIPNKDE
jgi:hypothetical protein